MSYADTKVKIPYRGYTLHVTGNSIRVFQYGQDVTQSVTGVQAHLVTILSFNEIAEAIDKIRDRPTAEEMLMLVRDDLSGYQTSGHPQNLIRQVQDKVRNFLDSQP